MPPQQGRREVISFSVRRTLFPQVNDLMMTECCMVVSRAITVPSSFSPCRSISLALGFCSFSFVDRVLDHIVEIGISPGQQKHIVCRDRCPPSVLAEALEIDGDVFCFVQVLLVVTRRRKRNKKTNYTNLCPNHFRQSTDKLRSSIAISAQGLFVHHLANGKPESSFQPLSGSIVSALHM